jgi:hypothetical protein
LATIEDRQTFALNDLIENPRRIDTATVATDLKGLWSIYHLVPNGLCTLYTIEFYTSNGGKLLLDRLLQKEVRYLWIMFYTMEEMNGPLRSMKFEAYAHKKILTDGIDGTAHLWTKNGISSSTRKGIAIPAGSNLVDVPDNNLNSLSRYALAIGINSPLYLLPSLTNVPVIDSGCTEDAYFVSEEKWSEQTLVREGRDNLSCSRKFLCCGGPSGHFHLKEVGRSSS